MKVYIGPYRNFFGLFQLVGLLRYIGVDEDKCHELACKIDDRWPQINEFFNWVYSKQKRNVKIRIDKYDTWSMDHTLALIALPMLKQLRATKHGAPGDMYEFNQTSNSGQYCFDFYEEDDMKAWEAGHKRWDEIMEKMIWSFEQVLDDDWEEQYWITKPELDLKDYPEDEGKAYTPVRWKTYGECDLEGRRKHQQRITEGLELFGKYYESLWD